MAIEKVMVRKSWSDGTQWVRCKRSSPNQLVIGPGITGKKLPAIPSSARKSPEKEEINPLVHSFYESNLEKNH